MASPWTGCNASRFLGASAAKACVCDRISRGTTPSRITAMWLLGDLPAPHNYINGPPPPPPFDAHVQALHPSPSSVANLTLCRPRNWHPQPRHLSTSPPPHPSPKQGPDYSTQALWATSCVVGTRATPLTRSLHLDLGLTPCSVDDATHDARRAVPDNAATHPHISLSTSHIHTTAQPPPAFSTSTAQSRPAATVVHSPHQRRFGVGRGPPEASSSTCFCLRFPGPCET
jgi:hypothetical protein